MSEFMITSLITIFGGLLIAGATYWFTKQREREAELRKEKLEHYKDFVLSLSGIVSGESTPDNQRAFALASNKLMLIAPQSVINALREFQQINKISNTNATLEVHDKYMSALFYQMRLDLKVNPSDDKNTFHVGLWASGVNSSKK